MNVAAAPEPRLWKFGFPTIESALADGVGVGVGEGEGVGVAAGVAVDVDDGAAVGVALAALVAVGVTIGDDEDEPLLQPASAMDVKPRTKRSFLTLGLPRSKRSPGFRFCASLPLRSSPVVAARERQARESVRIAGHR